MPIQPANYPFERLCVDFVGPLTLSRNRNRYLLVFTDSFTRYAEIISVRDCTAETAAFEFVNKIVNRYGTCKEILSDRGAAFESDLFRQIFNHEVSDKDVSEFRKPSLAERLKEMQDARETVRKFLSENYDERVKKYKAQTVRTFETGDLVLLAVPKGKGSSKFSAKFYGPFRVVAKVSEVNFRVRGVNMHDEQVVHIDRMKAFRSMRNRKPAAAKRECYPRRRMIPLALEGGSACRISPRREMSPPQLENTTLGVIYYELLQPNETITAERYQQQLTRLSRALKIKRPLYAKRHDKVIYQHDNARPHVAKVVKETLEALQWDVLPHPLYLPDIAPSDYHMFRSMTHGLARQHFTSYEEAKNWVNVWIASKDEEYFRHGIRMLPERWQKVVAKDGQYFE
ncbi:hypothetical protein LAZ67_3003970 [Cordylochernes scorpioides]|uniref:Integrase catalytic domain-containing protein n=1 Tax=Cordylochernes scorpioides TaxID=51811 RepID=A0ABY6K8Z2_9ARAC|nr:hypothetical protein LAZ67_3003970 [Cordylochernes scorpioides]